FRIISIVPQGSDILLTWTMPVGQTGIVQAATGAFSNSFSDLSGPIWIPGSGFTTNYLDVGAVTNWPECYYRVRLLPLIDSRFARTRGRNQSDTSGAGPSRRSCRPN